MFIQISDKLARIRKMGYDCFGVQKTLAIETDGSLELASAYQLPRG